MLFDVNNLFWHTGSVFAFTAGEFVSFAGITLSGTASQSINMGVAQDMGIGDGEAIPKLAICVGTAFTSSSAGLRIYMQFQGSNDSVNWTTYDESGALATSFFAWPPFGRFTALEADASAAARTAELLAEAHASVPA